MSSPARDFRSCDDVRRASSARQAFFSASLFNPARRPGALRPALRARRVRRRVRRDMKGVASHDIVGTALDALCNLDHRGAVGRRARHRRRRRHPDPDPRPLPPRGRRLRAARRRRVRRRASRSCRSTRTRPRRPTHASRQIVAEEGLTVLGWRDVPVDPDDPRRDVARARCRRSARSSSPTDDR